MIDWFCKLIDKCVEISLQKQANKLSRTKYKKIKKEDKNET
tara:strand:+ start:87 stop:209 length:123 start_codon:yes stop_codon:yes gene_type:complete